MELRDRIKAVRKEAGLTQAEFSTKLGFAPTSAASWEKTDAQVPSEPIKLLICKTFGVREEWLKYGNGAMKVDSSAELLNKLAADYNLGANQKALLSVAMEALDTLDDSTCELLLDRLFLKLQEIKQAQHAVNPATRIVDVSDTPDAAAQ